MGIIITNIIVEPGSSFSTVIRLRAGQPRIFGSILIMGMGVFCSRMIPHRLWVTPGILLKRSDSHYGHGGVSAIE